MEPVNGASQTSDPVCFCPYRYNCLVDVLWKDQMDIEVKANLCSWLAHQVLEVLTFT